jgi:hypothetical protein
LVVALLIETTALKNWLVATRDAELAITLMIGLKATGASWHTRASAESRM